MKKVIFSILFGISVAASAVAQDSGCCPTAKVEAKTACATSCETKSAEVKKSCGSCTAGCETKAASAKSDCGSCTTGCESKSAKSDCSSCTSGCEGKAGKRVVAEVWNEEAFMAEARRMMMAAEGKAGCCKSTAAKPVARGSAGCCNAPKQVAKFKVFVRGEGYRFFGCNTSAQQGRSKLASQGKHVGRVQAVLSRVLIG